MPFFRVLLQGTNLQMRETAGDRAITGFFTTRFVAAPSLAIAESKAILSVRRLWLSPKFATRPGALELQLTVSESSPCSAWQWLRAHNKGHSFYEKEAGA